MEMIVGLSRRRHPATPVACGKKKKAPFSDKWALVADSHLESVTPSLHYYLARVSTSTSQKTPPSIWTPPTSPHVRWPPSHQKFWTPIVNAI